MSTIVDNCRKHRIKAERLEKENKLLNQSLARMAKSEAERDEALRKVDICRVGKGKILAREALIEADLKESYELCDILRWAADRGVSVFRATDGRFYARMTTDFRSSQIIGAAKGVEGPQAAIRAAWDAREKNAERSDVTKEQASK